MKKGIKFHGTKFQNCIKLITYLSIIKLSRVLNSYSIFFLPKELEGFFFFGKS